jgi:hypothetical protein
MIETGFAPRGAVFGLSQDWPCINLFENFREHSLKQDLSNGTTVNPSLFSLVNTFKLYFIVLHQICV